MNIKKVCAQIAAAIAITAMIGLTVPARASGLTWNWSWSGSITGSGTLTTDALSNGSYLITGMSGTWDGNSISGLLAPGTCCSAPANDNLLLAGSPQLDLGGLAFSSNSTDINLYYDSYGGGYFENSPDVSYSSGTFSATLASVPEPGTLALLAAGLLGLGFVVRRRKLRAGPLA